MCVEFSVVPASGSHSPEAVGRVRQITSPIRNSRGDERGGAAARVHSEPAAPDLQASAIRSCACSAESSSGLCDAESRSRGLFSLSHSSLCSAGNPRGGVLADEKQSGRAGLTRPPCGPGTRSPGSDPALKGRKL